TTSAEVDAARLDAVGRGLQHLQRHRLVEAARARGAPGHDPLAGQRAADEHGLATVEAGNATAVVAQVEDVGGERGLVESGHVAKAARTRPRIVADALRPAARARRRRATSASSFRRTGTTSRTGRWRSTASRRPRGSATPTPGACWPPRSRDTPRVRRGSGRPPPC